MTPIAQFTIEVVNTTGKTQNITLLDVAAIGTEPKFEKGIEVTMRERPYQSLLKSLLLKEYKIKGLKTYCDGEEQLKEEYVFGYRNDMGKKVPMAYIPFEFQVPGIFVKGDSVTDQDGKEKEGPKKQLPPRPIANDVNFEYDLNQRSYINFKLRAGEKVVFCMSIESFKEL